MPWDPKTDLGGTVVLVHPTVWGPAHRLTRAGFLIPPLGLMYLSAQLRRNGIPAVLVNEEVDGERLPSLLAAARSRPPLLLGISANEASTPRILELLRRARNQSDVRIAIGGPASLAPERFLEAGADVVCLGEGDETILDLVAWARGERQAQDVPGAVFRTKDGFVASPGRPLLEDLDRLPTPDWESYPPDRIPFDNLYPSVQRPFASLMTSRGCPMRCSYCSSPTLWRHAVRRRSVESVLAEIDYLVGRFGVRFIDVYDDVFNLGRDWTTRFCEALIAKGVPVRWSAYFYPAGFDAEILRLAKSAGLRVLKIGVQSGSPSVLTAIGRLPATLEQARLYLDETTRLGLFSAADFIFGLPGETPETLDESIRYIRSLQADSVKIGTLGLLPGSPLDVHGIHPPVRVNHAELDAAIRRCLLGYYLRPRRLARTIGWSVRRGLSWSRFRTVARLAGMALAGQVYPQERDESSGPVGSCGDRGDEAGSPPNR